MNSPAAPFHVVVDAVLRASVPLKTAMGLATARIYTEPPQNAVLPYVVIGDDQVILESGGCADEAEIFATVHLWSKPATPDKQAQARAVGAAVIDALAGPLAVAGWSTDDWVLKSERYATDPDGSTHGIVELHYLLTEQLA